ncbi:MAG: esterase-like activity of phytase family protein [Pseudomonadota bacterium]
MLKKTISHLITYTFLYLVTAPTAHANKTPPLREKQNIAVISQPFVLDKKNPAQTKFGQLIWRGGLILSSRSPHFGGFSGLIVSNAGADLLAITDRGKWFKGKIVYENETPASLTKTYIGPLRTTKDRLFNKTGYLDTEAITQLSSRNYLIANERNHAIRMFSRKDNRPDKQVASLPLPQQMNKIRNNKGLESLDKFKSGPYKGWILTFAENDQDKNKALKGWLLKGKRTQPIYLANMGDYSITDLKILSDGSVLILERHFRFSTGLRTRIRYVKAKHIKPNAILKGEVILALASPLVTDNMEGLSVHNDAQGKLIITLISDDNFNMLQRTLLMQFELPKAIYNN